MTNYTVTHLAAIQRSLSLSGERGPGRLLLAPSAPHKGAACTAQRPERFQPPQSRSDGDANFMPAGQTATSQLQHRCLGKTTTNHHTRRQCIRFLTIIGKIIKSNQNAVCSLACRGAAAGGRVKRVLVLAVIRVRGPGVDLPL